MNTDYYAVIMAGGVGSRFWPLSTKNMPKQFLDLLGTGETLIQTTYNRLSKIIPEQNIFILTNDSYEELVKQELPDITDRQIVLEPALRNTAPCILLSALKIQKENPNGKMIVAPSDHWIGDEDEFAKDVKTAFEAVEKEETIMTLGVQPNFPHTGYGYIKYDLDDSDRVKKATKFTEKPNYETAKEFLEAGNYLWNAGIFIAHTQNLINAFEKHLPEVYFLLSRGVESLNTEKEKTFLNKEYGKARNISIDYGIMEKATNVKILPVSFDWDDLGSWGSLYQKMPKDLNENVVINSATYQENSHRNIIHTAKDKIVVLKGLNDYIVVENEGILMIYPKSEEQKIKEIRSKVQEKFGEDKG